MFKLKNLKILLLLLLFAFAGNDALADKGDTKYSYYVAYTKVQINKTGAGLVYAQGGTQKDYETNFNKSKAEIYRSACKMNESASYCDEIQDKVSAKTDFYLRAVEKEGYKFVCWKNENDEIISTSNNCTVEVTTTNYCGEYTEAESKDTTIWNNPQENNANYYDALYTAVFEPLVKDPLIKVRSNNTNLGMTTITHEDNSNAVENDIGDDVVLFAYVINYDKKFLGWQKNGGTEIISRENPWHLQVSEENAGEYTAVFEDGYKFCRMKNFGAEHRYVTAINDEGSLNNLTAIKLENSFDNVIANAGSVIEIYTDTKYVPIPDGEGTKKVTYHDFIVQNSSGVDKGYYNFSSGAYLRMPHYTRFADEGTWAFSQADITYNEEGKKTGLRFRDNNGQASFASLTNDLYSQWYIEPMDKDLETCENYFSLDPNKLVEVDGKYYTTLRTSWNVLFNPDQMTPYVVTEVDEVNVTFEMEPITGNIIPAGTPVIIETSSTDIEANRMVPTLTNAASGAVPEGNLLKVSTKYFPNQDAPVANCKGLIKNSNGQLAFGGNALAKVNGNEAYLQVAHEVVLPTKAQDITLAELVRSGNTKTLYNITDLTAVDAVDHATMLICKDNNGYASKDENTEQYIDFMHTLDSGSGLTSTVPVTYDQSNWIGLRLPGDAEFTDGSLRNKLLKGVVGRLVNTTNPEFVLDKNSLAVNEQGIAAPTSLNPFVAASFYGQNPQTSSVNSKEYFFVQPKPMEMANVEWAQWNGEKFVAPLKSSNNNWNPASLQGEFEFNGSYLEQGGVFLEEGHVYKMLPAVVKYKDNNNYDHVYVLGTVNDQGWSPRKGVEMYTTDGNIYTATVTVNNVNNGYGYFSFTKKLGGVDDNDWAAINSYRFGAVADGDFVVNSEHIGQELSLAYWSGDSRSFKVGQGTYKLTVNLSGLKLIITPAQAGAPGIKAATNDGYVVYPLQINKVTTENNGVITAIDNLQAGKTVTRVVYYNLMGVESDKPHPGINIVETRYSDGSRSTVKVVK